MKAAKARKKTELLTKIMLSANAGILPDESDLRAAEELGIDTDAVMEVFYVANGDD